MTITVYRTHHSISREIAGHPYAITWEEYRFDPASSEHRTTLGRWTHWRSSSEPVSIAAPAGWRCLGFSAESIYWLADRGEKGFCLMAKKSKDTGPSLFGDDPPEPTASAYPRAVAPPEPDRARLRPVVAELAAEVLAPTRDAIRRALAQLDRAIASDDGLDGVVTARAILEGVLEDAGKPAA